MIDMKYIICERCNSMINVDEAEVVDEDEIVTCFRDRVGQIIMCHDCRYKKDSEGCVKFREVGGYKQKTLKWMIEEEYI